MGSQPTDSVHLRERKNSREKSNWQDEEAPTATVTMNCRDDASGDMLRDHIQDTASSRFSQKPIASNPDPVTMTHGMVERAYTTTAKRTQTVLYHDQERRTARAQQ